jgi:gamma-glutamyltranspeptidase/glutathione hydrolase
MLNNELTDFDFAPGGPNEVGPHKRPRSSMAPTILSRDGKPFAAYGSPGGPTITTTVTEITLDLLEFGMTLPDAVAAPRVFSADYPHVTWEQGVPAASLEVLRQRGDQPDALPIPIGNVQGVWLDGAGWHGVADHRDGVGGVVLAS